MPSITTSWAKTCRGVKLPKQNVEARKALSADEAASFLRSFWRRSHLPLSHAQCFYFSAV